MQNSRRFGIRSEKNEGKLKKKEFKRRYGKTYNIGQLLKIPFQINSICIRHLQSSELEDNMKEEKEIKLGNEIYFINNIVCSLGMKCTVEETDIEVLP